MSKSNACEAGLLDLLFLNTDFATVGDAAGLQNSAAAGSLYMSLHTADPGEAGTQLTSEATYTSYARVPVARSGAGFSRSVSTISLVADCDFPASTGGAATALSHWAVGTASAGAGVLLYKGALSTPLNMASGVQPRIPATSSIVSED